MMICDADFEELFPHLFQTSPAPEALAKAGMPSTRMIACNKDDAARLTRRLPKVRRGPALGHDSKQLATA